MSSIIPESNLSPAEGVKNQGGKRCYKCDSEYHLANSPTCPKRNQPQSGNHQQSGRGRGRGRGGGGTTATTTGTSVTPSVTAPSQETQVTSDTSNTSTAPAAVWKYIHPANDDQILIVNGKTFKFCKYCKCHSTQKVGFYQLSHSSSDHVHAAPPRNDDTTPEGHHSPDHEVDYSTPADLAEGEVDPDPMDSSLKEPFILQWKIHDIAIPYHFFRTKVEELEIKVVEINTENQLADQFTKGLPQDKFVRDHKKLHQNLEIN